MMPEVYTLVSDSELQALASLLESESAMAVDVMVEHMHDFSDAQLVRLGDIATPLAPAQDHINLILAERRAPRLQAKFLQWLTAGADLEEGAILVAQAGYPRLDGASVRAELDMLADGIRPQLPQGSPFQKLEALNSLLRDRYDFRGNSDHFYDPDNSYLNRVLERRTGLPITLTIVYILLGRRLGLEIAGVPLPTHFIGALTSTPSTLYFDPFNGGRMLTIREVVSVVNGAGYAFRTDLLRPAGSRQIIERMLANLIHGYSEQDEPERAELIRRYLSTL